MAISTKDIKKLREITGAGLLDARGALESAEGDFDKATKLLMEKGAQIAESKSDRNALQGIIVNYIHPGDRIGVLLELNCETDFVARNEDFKKLAHNLALQVAGMHPIYIAPDDVPMDVLDKEKEVYAAQLQDKSKGAAEKALQGKLEAFYEAVCLIKQPFVLNPELKVEELMAETVGILKENIKIARFVRFEVGDRS
ncbi:TPA: elongation factor Ts [Patescibacteria group bacterium]|nr:elongation factor Ts [Patescibacteria group bacterium]